MAKNTAKEMKGVYNLNPTSMVMKLGSEEQREANKKGPVRVDGPGMPEAHEAAADEGVETRELHGHEAMKTRMHHHSKHNHGERKMHEDHHHAVRTMKGK